jgi:hypothetical protein
MHLNLDVVKKDVLNQVRATMLEIKMAEARSAEDTQVIPQKSA